MAGPGLAERLRDEVISARQIADWWEVPACLLSVFEDGSSISPRVARVPLTANEADRPSCSSSVVSGVPHRECCARSINDSLKKRSAFKKYSKASGTS